MDNVMLLRLHSLAYVLKIALLKVIRLVLSLYFYSSRICNLCFKRNIYLSLVTIAYLISDRIRMSGTQVFSHRSGMGIRAVAVPGLVCVCRYYYLFTPSS